MSLENLNSKIVEWLGQLGYPVKGMTTPMDSKIALWESYVDRTAGFYSREEKDMNGNTVDVKVRSCAPASLVDAAMAGLIYNEKASITIPGDMGDDGMADAFLQAWLDEVMWHDLAPFDIERMCDTGTVGWALHVRNVPAVGRSGTLRVVPACYDASGILPLEWESGRCTACAFESAVWIGGDKLTQVEVHRLGGDGNYEIACAFFDEAGDRVQPAGFLPADQILRTQQPSPTFSLARLAKRNPYWERSPMGVALFDDMVDVLETVDLAFDSVGNDIVLGRKMLGLPESMLRKDQQGNVYTPWEDGRQFFLATKSNVYEGNLGVFEYNPSLRSAENRENVSTALQMLGMRAGFGPKFFSLDSQGGITTAKQVASDNAELMRTVRRHEKLVRAAIKPLMEAVVGIYRALSADGAGLPDCAGAVEVTMGDSIMEDTDTMREVDRADVAAGLLEPWEYMVRWQGYTEEDAKAACGDGAAALPPLEA